LAPFTNWSSVSAATSAVPGSSESESKFARVVPTGTNRVAISRRVDPATRARLAELFGDSVTVSVADDPETRRYGWIAVTAEEKTALDTALRDRASDVRGVIVCGVRPHQFHGRWFSGRDWFLDEILEAA
jgi:hypothetical protein